MLLLGTVPPWMLWNPLEWLAHVVAIKCAEVYLRSNAFCWGWKSANFSLDMDANFSECPQSFRFRQALKLYPSLNFGQSNFADFSLIYLDFHYFFLINHGFFFPIYHNFPDYIGDKIVPCVHHALDGPLKVKREGGIGLEPKPFKEEMVDPCL